jgi:hypothetical protein
VRLRITCVGLNRAGQLWGLNPRTWSQLDVQGGLADARAGLDRESWPDLVARASWAGQGEAVLMKSAQAGARLLTSRWNSVVCRAWFHEESSSGKREQPAVTDGRAGSRR